MVTGYRFLDLDALARRTADGTSADDNSDDTDTSVSEAIYAKAGLLW